MLCPKICPVGVVFEGTCEICDFFSTCTFSSQWGWFSRGIWCHLKCLLYPVGPSDATGEGNRLIQALSVTSKLQ